MMALCRNDEAKVQMIEIANRMRAFFQCEIRDHRIATTHGETYVLELGDRSLPTVVVLHGGMTNHAFVL